MLAISSSSLWLIYQLSDTYCVVQNNYVFFSSLLWFLPFTLSCFKIAPISKVMKMFSYFHVFCLKGFFLSMLFIFQSLFHWDFRVLGIVWVTNLFLFYISYASTTRDFIFLLSLLIFMEYRLSCTKFPYCVCVYISRLHSDLWSILPSVH